MPQRIGILGGSFNPVHNAHIAIASDALSDLRLDFVLFIPLGVPPHKNSAIMAAPEDRLAMLRLATENESRFVTDTLELDRQGTTYTVDTMRELHKKYPGAEFFYIVGADTLFELKHWREHREVMKLTGFAVLPRANMDVAALDGTIAQYKAKYGANIVYLKHTASDISSQEIRLKCLTGHDAYGLPENVAEYIKSHNVYTPDMFLPWLRGRLKEKRYLHSISVAEEAEKLAVRWGADRGKAKLAGLLHDAAKGLGDSEMLAAAKEYSIPLNDAVLASPNLLHGEVGAAIVREELKINDKEMLSAIASHTFGKQGMSTLDKILFISDMIEPQRDFPGVDFLRDMAYNDLDGAMLACLGQTISFVIQKKQLLHGQSIDAWNDMLLSLREE